MVDVEELERALREATPGPWVAVDEPHDTYVIATPGGAYQPHVATVPHALRTSYADAHLVALARNALPALCAELRALRACVEAADAMRTATRARAWGQLSRDEEDPNYGRVCARCEEPLRRSDRYAHECLAEAYDAARAKLPGAT